MHTAYAASRKLIPVPYPSGRGPRIAHDLAWPRPMPRRAHSAVTAVASVALTSARPLHRDPVVNQRVEAGVRPDQAPLDHPVVGPLEVLLGVRRGVHVAEAAETEVGRFQRGDLGGYVLDEVVQVG